MGECKGVMGMKKMEQGGRWMGWKNGVMTVYFSLTFLLILSLLFSLMETARYYGIQMRIQCVTDMAVTSVFAEFQKELLTEYDMFFIDAAYGKESGTTDRVKLRLQDYVSFNMNPSKGTLGGEGVDLFSAALEGCEISELVYATDDSGQAFYHQAISVMKEEIGITMAEKIRDSLSIGETVREKDHLISEEKTKSDLAMEHLERMDQLQEQVGESSGEMPKEEINGKEEHKKEEEASGKKQENPIETIKKLKKMGILSLVIKDAGRISNKAWERPQNLVSKRVLQEGTGEIKMKEQSLPQMVQTILYDEYVMDRLSYWGESKAGESKAGESNEGGLAYEVEYLLGGKMSDHENLKKMAQKMIGMREAANFTYLLTDQIKRKEAETMAASIAGVGGGGLVLAVTSAILLAWSYAESILDVRHLFSGGRIPMLKTSKDWQTSLSEIPELLNHLDREVKEEESGFSYEDYLRFFLVLEEPSKKVFRTMDVVERNIQEIHHQPNVKLDQCIFSMKTVFLWRTNQRFFSHLGKNPQHYTFQSEQSFQYDF